MSDRFSGNIQIGGRISQDLMDRCNELCKDITDHDLDEYGLGWFNECVTADMEELRAFCRENNIAISIQWDAKYEFDGSIQFFIGDDFREYLCTNAGQITAVVSDMEKHSEMTVGDYIKSLGIPELPPLEIIPSESVEPSCEQSLST